MAFNRRAVTLFIYFRKRLTETVSEKHLKENSVSVLSIALERVVQRAISNYQIEVIEMLEFSSGS